MRRFANANLPDSYTPILALVASQLQSHTLICNVSCSKSAAAQLRQRPWKRGGPEDSATQCSIQNERILERINPV